MSEPDPSGTPSSPHLSRTDADAVTAIVDLVLGRAPTLGGARLLCVDGPAGSGKTTLAAAVIAELERRGVGHAVVHLDDVYPGWDGLAALDDLLEPVLRDLAEGRPGRFVRWDWHRDRPGQLVEVSPRPLVVVEGVGAGNRRWTNLCTLLVWVEEILPIRRANVIKRDGASVETEIEVWTRKESALYAGQRTRSRAEVLKHGQIWTFPN